MPQRRHINKPKPSRQAIVDPALGVIKRGMRAEYRDPRLRQIPEHPILRVARHDVLDRAKQDRVVADDQFGAFLDGLQRRVMSHRQASHDPRDLGLGIAPEQADVVPRLRETRRREGIKPTGDVMDGGHERSPQLHSQSEVKIMSRCVTGPGAGLSKTRNGSARITLFTGMIPRTELVKNTSDPSPKV